MSKKIEIDIPYNWKPELHHQAVMDANARFKVLIWHRRSRKTTFCINELIRQASRVIGEYWYIAPFFNQAKRIVWENSEMLPKYLPPKFKQNNSELKISVPNGSIIRFIGADNKDSLRGSGLNGVIFDEFDDISMEVFNFIIRPMLSLSRGWAIFAGTPKGIGNLYNLYNRGKSEQDHEWWADDVLDAETSGLLPEEEMRDLKAEVENGTMPKHVYEQEFMCKFVQGGAAVFRGVRNNLWDGRLSPRPDRKYKIGVDIAKLSDFTVITPIDLHNWKVGIPERFQHLDYPMIEAKIEAQYQKYNQCAVQVESNAAGEAVCDHLAIKGIGVKRLNVSEPIKEAMLKNLSILIETNQIQLPNYEPLLKELEAMRYERMPSGKLKMIVPDGIHDDCIMSLAHTCWELARIPEPVYQSEMERKFYQHRNQHGSPLKQLNI